MPLYDDTIIYTILIIFKSEINSNYLKLLQVGLINTLKSAKSPFLFYGIIKKHYYGFYLQQSFYNFIIQITSTRVGTILIIL